MMPVTLYGHRLSQPCRAVEILLRELDMAYTWHEIDFANGATHQPWFTEQINPLQTIPALGVNAPENRDAQPPIVLAESQAILRYLCRTVEADATVAHWYPGSGDLLHTARIDHWMDWHHNNIRRYDMFHHIMNLHLTVPMLKREVQNTLIKPLQDGLSQSLTLLEQHFNRQATSTQSKPTLCGGDHPTLADLAMTCELFQVVAIGYRFERYPLVSRWLDGMAQREHFKAVCAEIIEQGRTIRDQSGAYLDLNHAFA